MATYCSDSDSGLENSDEDRIEQDALDKDLVGRIMVPLHIWYLWVVLVINARCMLLLLV